MSFKKNQIKLIIIIMVFILINCIGVYAAYNYFAKDVVYTKSDGTEISVEAALNELYEKYMNNHIETGEINVTLKRNTWTYITISFENEYTEPPIVYYSYDAGTNGGSVFIQKITNTSFTLGYNAFGDFPKACDIIWTAQGN